MTSTFSSFDMAYRYFF